MIKYILLLLLGLTITILMAPNYFLLEKKKAIQPQIESFANNKWSGQDEFFSIIYSLPTKNRKKITKRAILDANKTKDYNEDLTYSFEMYNPIINPLDFKTKNIVKRLRACPFYYSNKLICEYMYLNDIYSYTVNERGVHMGRYNSGAALVKSEMIYRFSVYPFYKFVEGKMLRRAREADKKSWVVGLIYDKFLFDITFRLNNINFSDTAYMKFYVYMDAKPSELYLITNIKAGRNEHRMTLLDVNDIEENSIPSKSNKTFKTGIFNNHFVTYNMTAARTKKAYYFVYMNTIDIVWKLLNHEMFFDTKEFYFKIVILWFDRYQLIDPLNMDFFRFNFRHSRNVTK